MNLKGFRVAMFVIAAALLAMMLSGCGGDDNGGLSAADMARIEEAEKKAEEAAQRAEEAEEAAQKAEEAAQRAEEAEEAEEEYSPNDPGGTREDTEDRAAAQRIAASVGPALLVDAIPDNPDTAADESMPAVMGTGIRSGASIKSLSQARLGEDPMLSIAVTGGGGLSTADDSAATDAPAIAGFTGVSLEKDGPGAVTQTALVYSDAERSVRAFGDVYPYNRNSAGAGVESKGTADVVLTHRWVLAPVTQDDADTPADESLLSQQDAKISFDHGLSTTAVMSREVDIGDTVRGSYDGIAGQYTCAGGTAGTDDCTISLTAAGDVQLIASNSDISLLFKADDPDQLIPDQDYLAFGVWTEVPDNPTLGNPGKLRPFVQGNAGAFSMADVGSLDGSASYSGGAVGHYATRAAGSHMADQGRFTAAASLMADFDGGDNVALTGKIDGFMSEDGTAMGGWLVNLNGGSMLAGTRDGDIVGTTTGTTGSQAWEGVWDAWLFGTNKDTYPTGVAGRFQAEAGTAQPVSTPEGRINLFEDEGFAGVVGSFAGR